MLREQLKIDKQKLSLLFSAGENTDREIKSEKMVNFICILHTIFLLYL